MQAELYRGIPHQKILKISMLLNFLHRQEGQTNIANELNDVVLWFKSIKM